MPRNINAPGRRFESVFSSSHVVKARAAALWLPSCDSSFARSSMARRDFGSRSAGNRSFQLRLLSGRRFPFTLGDESWNLGR